jgi:hypothetical protein
LFRLINNKTTLLTSTINTINKAVKNIDIDINILIEIQKEKNKLPLTPKVKKSTTKSEILKSKLNQDYLANFSDFISSNTKYKKYTIQDSEWSDKQIINLATSIIEYKGFKLSVYERLYSIVSTDVQEIFNLSNNEIELSNFNDLNCIWTKTKEGNKTNKAEPLTTFIIKKFKYGDKHITNNNTSNIDETTS